MRAVLVIIVFWAVATTGAPVSAQPEPPREPDPISVSVSPFVYLRGGAVDELTTLQAGREAIVRGARRYAARAGEPFDFVPFAHVSRAIRSNTTYAGKVELARGFAEIGLAKYRELDHEGARENLLRAYSEFEQAGHQLVEPTEVAEVLLFGALASLETGGDLMGPLDVMKQMILLDPSRRVTKSAFPAEVVTFYESARLALERDVQERGPDEGLAEKIAEEGGADYVVVANALPHTNGSIELVSWLYDAAERQFRTSTSITVDDPTVERLEEASNRLTSRLLACLVEPVVVAERPAIPKGSGEGRFTLSLNFAYASYYSFPDIDDQPVVPFDHMGAAIGGGWFLTREFALVAMFQFLTSTSEFSGLVQPGFTTLRGFAGGELGLGIGRFRLSLGTLLEIAAISQITTCPAREVEPRRACDPSVTLPARHLFGVNARPRLSFRLLDAMHVYLAGSETFYFIPLAGNDFNFLTAGELGLQYRF